MEGKTALLQVKSLLHRHREHRCTPNPKDFPGLLPQSSMQIGYLALLDRGSPAKWIVVEEGLLPPHRDTPIHVVTLRADSDVALPRLCTEEFNRAIVSFEGRPSDMTFALSLRACTLAQPEVILADPIRAAVVAIKRNLSMALRAATGSCRIVD